MQGGKAMDRKYIKDKYYIAVFESRNHAIQVYQYLNRKKYKQYELVSTPCKIKVGCSYSIKFTDLKYYDFLKEITDKSNKKIYSVYEVTRNNGKRVLSKLDL